MVNKQTTTFRSIKDKRNYFILLSIFLILGFLMAYGLLVYNNPIPVSSPSFKPVVERRMVRIIAMAISAICQALATIAFQAVTNNKVITPSLLGYEALYSTIQTSIVFFFGVNALVAMDNSLSFFIQVAIMIVFSLLLYGSLLTGKKGDLELMLLVGVMLGIGLRSISNFMNRILEPAEFDLLQSKLLGSVNNADPDYFPLVIPIVLLCAIFLFAYSRKLNVLSLGRDVSINLGLHHKGSIFLILAIVSVLMSISTALLGSLTFYGFLTASLTYQVTKTFDYKYIFTMGLAIGFLIITSSYFLMEHIFNAQGVVSIIIELIGGIAFLLLLFRKEEK